MRNSLRTSAIITGMVTCSFMLYYHSVVVYSALSLLRMAVAQAALSIQ